jgi:hypothetical protein
MNFHHDVDLVCLLRKRVFKLFSLLQGVEPRLYAPGTPFPALPSFFRLLSTNTDRKVERALVFNSLCSLTNNFLL